MRLGILIPISSLIYQGLHPRLITEGFEVAKKKALEVP